MPSAAPPAPGQPTLQQWDTAPTAAAALPPPAPPQPPPPLSAEASAHTPLPTSTAAPWLLSPEASSIAPGPAGQQLPPDQQHAGAAAQLQVADESPGSKLKLGGSASEEGSRAGAGAGAGGSGSPRSPLARQVSGFPDILYRPTAGPELLGAGAEYRGELSLYCCNCGYRGESVCRPRCGVARTLWVLATLCLGLACCSAAADIHHYCPRCNAHVATSKNL